MHIPEEQVVLPPLSFSLAVSSSGGLQAQEIGLNDRNFYKVPSDELVFFARGVDTRATNNVATHALNINTIAATAWDGPIGADPDMPSAARLHNWRSAYKGAVFLRPCPGGFNLIKIKDCQVS